ncbi:MAG: nucleotidyltransferase family protein, partial [Chloroflexota bacterium]
HLKASTVHDILVISGHEAEAVEAIARAAGVSALRNTDYASGEMLSSLQTAVSHLHPSIDAVLVMLADQPLVTPAIIDQLLTAYRQGLGGIAAPVYEGRRGNPVLISRRFFPDLLALPPGSAPRALLQQQANHVALVAVDSDAVVVDLDEFEEYERRRPG